MKELEEIIESIKAKRQKQIGKGYTVNYDQQHKNGQRLCNKSIYLLGTMSATVNFL